MVTLHIIATCCGGHPLSTIALWFPICHSQSLFMYSSRNCWTGTRIFATNMLVWSENMRDVTAPLSQDFWSLQCVKLLIGFVHLGWPTRRYYWPSQSSRELSLTYTHGLILSRFINCICFLNTMVWSSTRPIRIWWEHLQKRFRLPNNSMRWESPCG